MISCLFNRLKESMLNVHFVSNRLKESKLNVRFVSNTSKETSKCVQQRLTNIGFEIQPNEMSTSLTTARRLVETRGLRPYLLLDERAEEEFNGTVCYYVTNVDVAYTEKEITASPPARDL